MSRGPVYGSRGTSVQKKQEDGVRALLTTVWEPEERIPVVVHAPGPISREGAISRLRRHRVVEVADEWDGREPGVAVLLVESVDEDTLGWMRRIVRGQGLRAVLVADAIREAELFDVIACGIGAVVWRREATGDRLVQAVRAAARGGGDLPPDLLGLLVKQVNALRPGTALARRGRARRGRCAGAADAGQPCACWEWRGRRPTRESVSRFRAAARARTSCAAVRPECGVRWPARA
jgi:DNA-binding NarL/FixJ family response regulator